MVAFAFAAPPSQASPADHVRCNGWIFSLSTIPSHDLAALDVDHDLRAFPDPAYGGGQTGDVPTPHLVCSLGPAPWNGARFLRCSCTTATVKLARGRSTP